MLSRLILAEAAILALAGAITGTILGIHLTWVGTIFYRDLAGIELRTAFATIPVAIGWGVVILMTLAAAAPAAMSLMRREPAALLATGRNG
jgi:ABC-type antimicrobial peptide transport system permease subunit